MDPVPTMDASPLASPTSTATQPILRIAAPEVTTCPRRALRLVFNSTIISVSGSTTLWWSALKAECFCRVRIEHLARLGHDLAKVLFWHALTAGQPCGEDHSVCGAEEGDAVREALGNVEVDV